MLHAVRNAVGAQPTERPDVLIYIGPSVSGVLLEVGVVETDARFEILHAMRVRQKFLTPKRSRR